MYEMLPVTMSVGVLTALSVLLVLRERVSLSLLTGWLVSRVLIASVRMIHGKLALSGKLGPIEHTFGQYRLLSLLDALAWSALGWAVTPIMNLEVALVTISVLIGVAALGTFMLHVDLVSASLFITPVLLPNALYALSRHDDLGVFCAVSVIGLMVLLLVEARRSNRRLSELLRLRFQSEQVATAQADALSQAEHLAQTRARFVATMSHEMRTPLHGILGLVRLLRQREAEGQATHQLDLIRGSGEHLLNVINDVLDFSRMEAGALPVHRQSFNLHALLSEVAETTRVNAAEKGLALQLQLDLPAEADVVGDPVRLRQVLHNLLGNAIKFTPAGSVRLHAWRDAHSDLVYVAVHDTGIGIPPQEHGRIFEAFHQAQGSAHRRFGGTGLGLTISRELSRAMGGELACSSQVGQGSVFTLLLPLPLHGTPRVSAPVPASPRAALPPPEAPHVLLVEDNAVNALVAEAELNDLGLHVTVLRDGLQAVQWLESHEVDLVLMDCEMPELDGFEATRRIRDREQHTGRKPVSIVALTANGWEAYARRCLEVGMNDHLAKPFRPDELARTVSRHVRLGLCPAT